MTLADSMGVNLHLSYTGTPYESDANYAVYSKLLGESGIKHVRDGFLATTGRALVQAARIKDLHARYGIKTLLHIGNPQKPTQPFLDFIKAQGLVPCLSGLEGVNEWDGQQKWRWVKGGADRDAVVAEIKRQQRELWNGVKNDPALKHLPVLSASTGQGLPWYHDPGRCVLTGICDYGNVHPYPGGREPEIMTLPAIQSAKTLSGGKPAWFTEHGYHNAVNTTGTHPPATEQKAAEYLPRLYKHCYENGVVRTYWYELVNHKTPDLAQQENNFGLLRHDLSPKPAYHALKALLAESSEPTPDPDWQARAAELEHDLAECKGWQKKWKSRAQKAEADFKTCNQNRESWKQRALDCERKL